jgi:hypothetical protein
LLEIHHGIQQQQADYGVNQKTGHGFFHAGAGFCPGDTLPLYWMPAQIPQLPGGNFPHNPGSQAAYSLIFIAPDHFVLKKLRDIVFL